MFTFLLVLLIIDSLVLIAAILLQSGKGNGLAASFGGVSSSADSLLGTRQAGKVRSAPVRPRFSSCAWCPLCPLW